MGLDRDTGLQTWPDKCGLQNAVTYMSLSARGPKIFVPYFVPNFCLHPVVLLVLGLGPKSAASKLRCQHDIVGLSQQSPDYQLLSWNTSADHSINPGHQKLWWEWGCRLWTWPCPWVRSHVGLRVLVRSTTPALVAIWNGQCPLYHPNVTLILALFSIPPFSHWTIVFLVSCFQRPPPSAHLPHQLSEGLC